MRKFLIKMTVIKHNLQFNWWSVFCYWMRAIPNYFFFQWIFLYNEEKKPFALLYDLSTILIHKYTKSLAHATPKMLNDFFFHFVIWNALKNMAESQNHFFRIIVSFSVNGFGSIRKKEAKRRNSFVCWNY